LILLRGHRLGKTGRAMLAATTALAAEPIVKAKRPVDGISDNSFFIEEAYNQEAGVVQHIFNAAYGVSNFRGPEQRAWT